jgi:hypothetical protein
MILALENRSPISVLTHARKVTLQQTLEEKMRATAVDPKSGLLQVSLILILNYKI